MSDLLADLAAEPYEPRGILNSEMALIIGTCRKMGIDAVMESGRARGQSTRLLAKYLPGTEIHSVELNRNDDALFSEQRLKDFANVSLYYGDGNTMLPTLIEMIKGRRLAILLDGPKGHAALDLMAKCFQYPNVVVGFIHDMRTKDHGELSPYRLAAERRFPGSRFSDDPAYVELTKHLDDHIGEETGWKPYHARKHDQPESPFESIGSYGPTVGVFYNRTGQAEVAA